MPFEGDNLIGLTEGKRGCINKGVVCQNFYMARQLEKMARLMLDKWMCRPFTFNICSFHFFLCRLFMWRTVEVYAQSYSAWHMLFGFMFDLRLDRCSVMCTCIYLCNYDPWITIKSNVKKIVLILFGSLITVWLSNKETTIEACTERLILMNNKLTA